MAEKFGKLYRLDDTAPVVHPAVWERERTSGPDRLRVGGGPKPTATVLALAAELNGPLFVLVDLRVPRDGRAGRFESPALRHAEVDAFVGEFAEFFEQDARAGLWVGETAGDGLVVLDEHNLIYAYGDLDALQAGLSLHGYSPGTIALPVPHSHHYHPELDHFETRLRANTSWNRVLPLLDDVDD